MSLKGKLIAEIEIKSDGDAFHELCRYKPHHISTISSDKIQGCDVHEGEFGTVGSIIFWNYTDDGKAKVCKQFIEAFDEANKSWTYKVIEGDLLELYNYFIISVHVDTAGERNLVKLTLEFEKLNENSPYPYTFMDFLLGVTKDIEAHHLKQ